MTVNGAKDKKQVEARPVHGHHLTVQRGKERPLDEGGERAQHERRREQSVSIRATPCFSIASPQ